MLEIDGSKGGAILRTSLFLSALTQKPFRIYNIRANKEKPGLKPQHLTTVRAVRKICRGELIGDFLGSKEITFIPGKIVPGKYRFVIPTAGSTTLLAQTVIPILMFQDKKSSIRIIGGTHVKHAPCYDYFEHVFLKALNFLGVKVNSKLIRSGYYPEGNGEIEVNIEKSDLEFLGFFPKEEEIKVIIRISNLPFSIALREKKVFVQNGIENVRIVEENNGVGNAVFCYRGFEGSCGIGEKGLRAEVLAEQTLKRLLEGDPYIGDQLLPYIALYSFKNKINVDYRAKITEHVEYISSTIEKFLPLRFILEKERDLIKILFNRKSEDS